jgi:hypothetical protein
VSTRLDLLDAVEALTRATVEHHPITDVAGKYLRTHTTHLEPLLTRLRDAADPSGAATDSVASTGLARVPVNLTAVFEHAKITAQIRDWCRMRGVDVTRPPVVDVLTDLQRWHASTLPDNEFNPDWPVRQLRAWAHTIEGLLDPPARPFEAKRPCPVCGAAHYGDRINGGGWVIEIRYDIDDAGRMVNERAVCRNPDCRTEWYGHAAVLELAEEQHEREEA